MRRSRGVWRLMAAVAVFAVVAAACSNNNDNGGGGGGGGPTKTVKIEFFGALSGDYKLLVIHGFNAAKLAFDQANAAGDLPVKIVFEGQDTQGSPDQATPLAQKVVNDSDVVAIIGPEFSGESAATGDLFDQAGIPFVTGSATDDALATHGWTHWFRGVANNSDEANPTAAYLANVVKPNCTFVASDGSAYGHGLSAIVETAVNGAGGKALAEEQVQPGGKDYSALVTKIKGSGCSAVFYGGYSPEGGLIRKQMTQSGLTDVQMFGGDGLKDDAFLSVAGSAGEGTISACPCVSPADLITAGSAQSDAIQKFIDDYNAANGEDPGIYAAEGWDIAQMMIAAFKEGDTTRDKLTSYFANLSGYEGLAKTYTFEDNGELTTESKTMYLYEDKSGEWAFLGSAADLAGA